VKYKFSTKIRDLRKQEKIYFSVKDYDKAEFIKKHIDKLEAKERLGSEEQLDVIIARQEKALKGKQQLALASLLTRI